MKILIKVVPYKKPGHEQGIHLLAPDRHLVEDALQVAARDLFDTIWVHSHHGETPVFGPVKVVSVAECVVCGSEITEVCGQCSYTVCEPCHVKGRRIKT